MIGEGISNSIIMIFSRDILDVQLRLFIFTLSLFTGEVVVYYLS